MNYIVKSALLAATLSCCITLNCTAAELELKQAPEGPSYEDTVNFLVKLSKYFIDANDNEKIDSITNCSVAYSYTIGGVSGNGDIDMKRVTSVSLRAPNNPSKWRPIVVELESPQITSGNVFFIMHNITLGERFAKALNHLRKLCGAKDDPF